MCVGVRTTGGEEEEFRWGGRGTGRRRLGLGRTGDWTEPMGDLELGTGDWNGKHADLGRESGNLKGKQGDLARERKDLNDTSVDLTRGRGILKGKQGDLIEKTGGFAADGWGVEICDVKVGGNERVVVRSDIFPARDVSNLH